MRAILAQIVLLLINQGASAYLFNPETMYRVSSQLMANATNDQNSNLCSKKLFEYTNNPEYSTIFNTLFVSTGKSVNDLGNYEKCSSMKGILKYALVTIDSLEVQRQRIQMGLCVPFECNTTALSFFNKMYQQGIKYTKYMHSPGVPNYTFPAETEQSLMNQSFGFWIMTIILIAIFCLSIFGIFIQRGKIGDKQEQSSMVEAIEEDANKKSKISIIAKKTKWALFVYSFSIIRNFQEIFMRPNKSIKDKKFEIFNGLKFLMAIWIMLGNVYLLGSQYGNTGPQYKKQIEGWLFTQIIVSADLAISFFYFMSGFIVMFSLIKKYQRGQEHVQSQSQQQLQKDGSHYIPSTQRRVSFYEEGMMMNDCETLSIPKLNKRAMIKQIITRWLRLAYPTYFVVLFTLYMLMFFGSGPVFSDVINYNFITPLRKYWWSIIFFVSNVFPWENQPGLYWMYYISNDLQFYALVMMPAINIYQRKSKRWLVITYLVLLILMSMSYLFWVSITGKFSSILVIQDNVMYNSVYRRPFGPAGFYAIGILLSIFYFEYSQSESNKDLRTKKAVRFLRYIGKNKNRPMICQVIAFFMIIFVVFIRFTSFGGELDIKDVNNGKWPLLLNALYTAFAPYIFITGFVLMFIPIFLGKLSILRDIFASDFFRPLARLSYSAFLISGIVLFWVFFTHEQSIYYDHKNMMFIYFALVFFTYVISTIIAVFLEYPFRTMGKVVFSPPKKILRLNKDLAKELNTNFVDNMFNDDYSDDDDASSKNLANNEMQSPQGEYDGDDYDDDENDLSGQILKKKTKNSLVDLTIYHRDSKNNVDENMHYSGGFGAKKMNINLTLTASNISGPLKGNNMEDYSDREQLIYSKEKHE